MSIVLTVLYYIFFAALYVFPFHVIGIPSFVCLLLLILPYFFDILASILCFIAWVISIFIIINEPFSWFTVLYGVLFLVYMSVFMIPGIVRAVKLHKSNKSKE